MSKLKLFIVAISLIFTTNLLVRSENLRLLDEKDWKGHINIKNNVGGFDETANIEITNNVNASKAKDEEEVEEFRKNLLNHRNIDIPNEESFANLIKAINSLSSDASKVVRVHISFNNKAPFNKDTKSAFSKLTNLSFFSLDEMKGESSDQLLIDILGSHKVEHLYISKFELSTNKFLETLVSTSSNSLLELFIFSSILPTDFYKVFGVKSLLLTELVEIRFGGLNITDDLLKEAFNEKSSIRKYVLPKNKITDAGLIYLIDLISSQMSRKVFPWVLDVPYNNIEMEDEKIFTAFAKLGGLKEKNTSLMVEIYENPLKMVKDKLDNLHEKYDIFFNDFDNEGAYDDL